MLPTVPEEEVGAGGDDGIPMDGSYAGGAGGGGDPSVLSGGLVFGSVSPSGGAGPIGFAGAGAAAAFGGAGAAAGGGHDFSFPMDGAMDGVMENRDPQTLAEKIELLKALDEMKRLGTYKPRGAEPTLKDPKVHIQFEYDSAQVDSNTMTAVDFAKGALKMGSGVLEGLAKTANINILNGFHSTLTADMSKFNRPLSRLYKKHWKRGPVSPELELGFLVVGSLLWVMFCNWRGMPLGSGGITGGSSTSTPPVGSDPFARPAVPAPFDISSPPDADTPAVTTMPGPSQAPQPPTAAIGVGARPWISPPPGPQPSQPTQPSAAEKEAEAIEARLARAREELAALDARAQTRVAQLHQIDMEMDQRRSNLEREAERAAQNAMMRAAAQAQAQMHAMGPKPLALAPSPVGAMPSATMMPPPAFGAGFGPAFGPGGSFMAPHAFGPSGAAGPSIPSPIAPSPPSTGAKRKVVLGAAAAGAKTRAKDTGLVVRRRDLADKTRDVEASSESEDDAVDRLVGDMSRLSVQDEDEEEDGRSAYSGSVYSSVSRSSRSNHSSISRSSGGSSSSGSSASSAGSGGSAGSSSTFARLQALGIATALPAKVVDAEEEEAKEEAKKAPATTPGRRSARKPAPTLHFS